MHHYRSLGNRVSATSIRLRIHNLRGTRQGTASTLPQLCWGIVQYQCGVEDRGCYSCLRDHRKLPLRADDGRPGMQPESRLFDCSAIRDRSQMDNKASFKRFRRNSYGSLPGRYTDPSSVSSCHRRARLGYTPQHVTVKYRPKQLPVRGAASPRWKSGGCSQTSS